MKLPTTSTSRWPSARRRRCANCRCGPNAWSTSSRRTSRRSAPACAETAKQVDVLCGNLEDAIPVDAKEAARAGLHRGCANAEFGDTALWVRVNCLNSPWILDDLTEIVAGCGNKLDVIMIPKVEGPWDIHFVDQYLALLEAQHGVKQADPHPRPAGNGRGREERRVDRRRQPAHARHEPRPGRPGGLARHEDHARRRRPPGLRRAGRPGGRPAASVPSRSRTCGTTRWRGWWMPAPPAASAPSTAPSAT